MYPITVRMSLRTFDLWTLCLISTDKLECFAKFCSVGVFEMSVFANCFVFELHLPHISIVNLIFSWITCIFGKSLVQKHFQWQKKLILWFFLNFLTFAFSILFRYYSNVIRHRRINHLNYCWFFILAQASAISHAVFRSFHNWHFILDTNVRRFCFLLSTSFKNLFMRSRAVAKTCSRDIFCSVGSDIFICQQSDDIFFYHLHGPVGEDKRVPKS